MLFLLSPAKTLDYESPLPDLPHTLPVFVVGHVLFCGERRLGEAAAMADGRGLTAAPPLRRLEV